MGFSIFSALGGAASQYTKQQDEQRKYALEQMRETSSRLQERFDTAIAERNKKKSEYEELGAQLTGMGLSEDQALVILQGGVDKAKEIVDRVPLAQKAIEGYSIKDIVTLTDPERTGMSLQEGINNLIGIASTKPLAPEQEYKSGAANRAWERQKRNLEEQYGMSYDEIRNIAYNNVERGALPKGSVDTGDLYLPETLQIKRAQQQLTLGDLEIEEKEIVNSTLASFNKAKLAEARANAKAAKITADNLPDKIKQINEKHEIDMQNAKLDQAKAVVNLQWQGDLLEAELNYKLAQTAAEEADANGTDLLKLNDVRSLYKDSVNFALEKEFAGEFSIDDATGKPIWTGGPEGTAKFEQRSRQLGLNWLETMRKNYGLTANVLSVYESFAGAPVRAVPKGVQVAKPLTTDEMVNSGFGYVPDGTLYTAPNGGIYTIEQMADGRFQLVQPQSSTYFGKF